MKIQCLQCSDCIPNYALVAFFTGKRRIFVYILRKFGQVLKEFSMTISGSQNKKAVKTRTKKSATTLMLESPRINQDEVEA